MFPIIYEKCGFRTQGGFMKLSIYFVYSFIFHPFSAVILMKIVLFKVTLKNKSTIMVFRQRVPKIMCVV